MYSEMVIEHFLRPRHVGTIQNPDGYGEAGGGTRCPEDLAHVRIRVAGGRLVEVKHKTLGCPVAIAASSLTCEMALGRTLAEAREITAEMVIEGLRDMPEHKEDSVVAPAALQRAIADYRQREKTRERYA
ncbi:MAG TPA: iron-sulfur cluster assembly scaffold protein [Anaerolineae bacterium]|jgi:NifU-like protein involved in Fe-S cluster formation|nr:iron-sulfur cluster assembly scaffold protein [Anaerolineae bacterium]